MAFQYDHPGTGRLQQGEIIERLFELLYKIPTEGVFKKDKPADLDVVHHPISVVVTPDCDLEWDFKARNKEAESHKLLEHVLFCGLFTEAEIRARGITSQLWKRVYQNQDERYHMFFNSLIEGGGELQVLIADFKIILSLPINFVYWLVETKQVQRSATIPSPYLEDIIHRLSSFLGRVAVPTPQDDIPQAPRAG